MIQVTQVIEYLRTLLPAFRVDGAARLAEAQDDSRLQMENGVLLTTLFVMLGNFTAQTLSYETFLQEYDERLTIIACIDNKQDRTGKYAQQFVYQLRLALFQILLNYPGFDTDSHSLQYIGDQIVEMDRARYWHKFEFNIRGRLEPVDGYAFDLDKFNRYVADWMLSDAPEGEAVATDDLNNLYDP